jgi:uncharacterized damage-inducible protein DinB
MVASLSPLSAAELALRAAPHLRTIGHIAAHIVAARARMIHWILVQGDDRLDALALWDGFDQPAPRWLRPTADLVDGLETTGQVIQEALAQWTVDDLDRVVSWCFGDQTSTYTRQRVIWNLVRHDYHHYGELALTLGAHGLCAPDF